ncbi:transcriptional regulator [Alphaproteobacteria bacterium]|nr:transcriptional regulator [Alphaproteobacteria bacterium]
MTMKLTKFDILESLDTEEKIKAYLCVIFEQGDAGRMIEALGNVARARGMAKVARKANVSRANLYRSLSKNGRNIRFDTLVKVISAMGMKLPAPVNAAA